MRGVVVSFFILAVAAAPAAWADPGHSPARAKPGAYDGHAAALGEPGDPEFRNKRVIEVVMTDDMRFEPKTIMVRKGETIRFIVRNKGKLKHEMVLGAELELLEHAKQMQKFPEMEHDDSNAVTVEPGDARSFVWKFTNAGDFKIGFACLIPGHFEGGMKGRIMVR